MNVKAILQRKGSEVVTAPGDITLSEAVAILEEHKIGAIVIVGATGDVRGILSERDVVRALAREGSGALDGPVSRYMTGKVVRCTQENSVNEVMTVMTNSRFRHLPVEADGRLAGIVSIGDVVRMRIEEVEREAEDMKAYIAS